MWEKKIQYINTKFVQLSESDVLNSEDETVQNQRREKCIMIATLIRGSWIQNTAKTSFRAVAQMRNIHNFYKEIPGRKTCFLACSFFLSPFISLAIFFSLNNSWETKNNKDKRLWPFKRSVKPLPPVGRGSTEGCVFLAHLLQWH